MQHLYETDSDRSSIELTSKSKVTELRNMYSGKSKDNVTDDYASSHITDSHSCNICNDQSGPFIILSCNHIFHIKCLVEVNFKDVYKYPILDTEYFESRRCITCNENMQTEDMMYLHSKFLSSTKKLICKHQTSIENLENQLK